MSQELMKITLTMEQAQRAVVHLAKASYQDVADIIDAVKHQAVQPKTDNTVAINTLNEKISILNSQKVKLIAEEKEDEAYQLDVVIDELVNAIQILEG